MINNKNELIAFMDKYGIVPVTPVVTIKKGYICYGSTKLKEYFKIELVERCCYQGSLVWN